MRKYKKRLKITKTVVSESVNKQVVFIIRTANKF